MRSNLDDTESGSVTEDELNEEEKTEAVGGEVTKESSQGNADEASGGAASAQKNEEGENATGGTVQEIDPAIQAILGDLEVPEGIDPSFLAALPAEMREEVIQEHLRTHSQQRIRQRAQQTAALQEAQAMVDINLEFLAALPLNIQEEVLAQQRLEQQRQAAAAVNPNDPVNTPEFFQNLQPSLRQAILTDMEDSQIIASRNRCRGSDVASRMGNKKSTNARVHFIK